MTNVPLDIVVPIYNEGDKILRLFEKFEEIIRTNFRVLLCYDSEEDNIFEYKKYFNFFSRFL